MDRSTILVVACSASAKTASAALMNGWISSILIKDAPGKRHRRARGIWIISEDVAENFVKNFGLDRLLHEMLRAFLERRKNVFLVADGGNHHDARLCVLAYDALDGLDALHLRHGDVHKHDIGLGAVVFRNGRQAVAGFTRYFAAELLNHLDQVLAGEDGVVHHQIADRLLVFSKQRSELLHDLLLNSPHRSGAWI